MQANDILAVQQLVTDTGFFSPQEVAIAVELVEQHLQQGSASGYFFYSLTVTRSPNNCAAIVAMVPYHK